MVADPESTETAKINGNNSPSPTTTAAEAAAVTEPPPPVAVAAAAATPTPSKAKEKPPKPEEVININVGILGHVDSGKTSLVKTLSTLLSTAALDKSKQSRQRGMYVCKTEETKRIESNRKIQRCRIQSNPFFARMFITYRL
jgi:hypothetical protein